MPPKGGNKKNLRRLTTEEARKIGREGGKASVKARREKKLMSQIYAGLISNGIETDIEKAAPKIIRKGGSPAVALMRELREGTEGSKVKTETVLTINTDDEKIQQILKEHGVNKSESEN